MEITYKIASTQQEFEQIHRLNYKTFVEEIPQHHHNQEQRLVDRYHAQNTYLIACDQGEVVGMIAVRDQRPFSLDHKLEQLDDYLPECQSMCEIRLLAVDKKYRRSRTFFGIAQYMADYCLQKNYDMVIMSGTVRQLKLYRQMGFVPFAQLVGAGEALYQPMFLTKETYRAALAARLRTKQVSFLPGPVPIHAEVSASLQARAISHRSAPFLDTMKKVQNRLCEMTNSKYVQVLAGTGTLANDCIAAQLSVRGEKGLILVNGEFGKRLTDHAIRAGLEFVVLEETWGQPFSIERVYDVICKERTKWLWAVHGETSTGMLNDMNRLKDVCQKTQNILCVDAISTLGAVSLDLEQVEFASGVSGKAIGGYTGLSFVFHRKQVHRSLKIPRYLDLGLYQETQSVPFSHSSNLLQALLSALELNSQKRDEKTRQLAALLRKRIEEMGLSIVTPASKAMPYIITIEIPSRYSSVAFGDRMASFGFQMHYESAYLVQRNWLQISILGQEDHGLDKMLNCLEFIVTAEN